MREEGGRKVDRREVWSQSYYDSLLSWSTGSQYFGYSIVL